MLFTMIGISSGISGVDASPSHPSRGRELALAAAAGIVAGISACASTPTANVAGTAGEAKEQDPALLEIASPEPAEPAEVSPDPSAKPRANKRQAKLCCRGLNDCAGKGNCKTGSNGCVGLNDCKGKGGCAPAVCPPGSRKLGSPETPNGGGNCCRGKNECKGKGGCQSDQNACKGLNQCKGLGGCSSGDC